MSKTAKTRAKRKTPGLPPVDVNQRYTLEEGCAYLRISRTHLYNRIRAGTLRVIVDGSRKFIPGQVIVEQSRVA